MPSMFKGAHSYKGALHCHTSVSDGRVPPMELLKQYRDRGYSFVAVTDHDHFTDYPAAEGGGFITLPGAELIFSVQDFKDNIRGTHVVTFARGAGQPIRPGPVEYCHALPCADMNRYLGNLRDCGGVQILAHPYWSWMGFEDAARVEGCFAVEVFNGVCELVGTGLALAYWDWLLRRGRRVFGVATDDHHGLGGDFARGWVCVSADGLSREAVVDGLLSGSFYASTGPEILDFGLDGGKAYVRCAKASAVRFVVFGENCWPENPPAGANGVEYGEYALTGREKYVRAEVQGFDGSLAWTNPIFF